MSLTIQEASAANRLALVRSVGPYSGGTRVLLVQENKTAGTAFVRPAAKPKPGSSEIVECNIDDLVIRRSAG